MSIESKIAEILAESKTAELESQVAAEDVVEAIAEEELKPAPKADEPNNKKNNVDTNPQKGEKKSMKEEDETSEEEEIIAEEEIAESEEVSEEEAAEELKAKMKEDIDAMLSDEELSEEFKTKAATIFEAAVMARVKQEVARVEKEFEARLEEESAKNAEGLVEQVDGYLGYVAEQWMVNNELALESGMKAEILEGFVGGLKGLFEEHYIDIPEERFDVLGSMEDHISELEEKLDEQMAANVEMAKYISESQRKEIIGTAAEGLSDAEAEKFHGLAEELSFEDAESFEAKVQTIRENYFSKKADKSEAIVESVVTDAPVEELNESVEKKVQLDPRMAAFVAALNKK